MEAISLQVPQLLFENCAFNSLAPGKFEWNFRCNFQTNLSDWWLRHLLQGFLFTQISGHSLIKILKILTISKPQDNFSTHLCEFYMLLIHMRSKCPVTKFDQQKPCSCKIVLIWMSLDFTDDGKGISCEIVLIWMSLDFTDDQSTLVQVMAWCRQATSHYLSQCWPRSLSPYGVTRPQWVNLVSIDWGNGLLPW